MAVYKFTWLEGYILNPLKKVFGVNANKIIHCRDCKFQHLYRTGSCPYFTTWGSTAPDDWYCADAKRKEKEHEVN